MTQRSESRSLPRELTADENRATLEGARMAQKFFEKRGNHSEVHLSKSELATLLSVVWQIARESK